MRTKSVAWVCLVVATVSGSAWAKPEDVGPGYDIAMSRMVPLRDGVELEAWITKPSHLQGKAPAVLTLTQYDIDDERRGGPRGEAAGFAKRGYVFVQVLVRGAGAPGGSRATTSGSKWGATATTSSSGLRPSRGAMGTSSPSAALTWA